MRVNQDPDRQDQQHHHQDRGHVFAHRIQQSASVQRYQDHQCEEEQAVEQQTVLAGVTQPGLEPHFISHQAGAGGGEGRPHDDVDGNGQRRGCPGRQMAGHRRPATAALSGAASGNGDQGQQRQTHRRQQKTDHGGQQMLTGHEAGQRWKNDVACPQIERKRHKTQSEYVGQLQ